MQILYAVSTWNFSHYARTLSFERLAAHIRELGWGIEVWANWEEEQNLFDKIGRERLKTAVGNMPLSLHGDNKTGFEHHKMQVNAASHCGAGIIVVHATHFMPPGTAKEDLHMVDLAVVGDIVEYASSKGVTIALENSSKGDLVPFVSIFERVDGLKFCLDTGHVYGTPYSMAEILEPLKHRLAHLHLEDILLPIEEDLPVTNGMHYTPGTGGIPRDDWDLIRDTLRDIGFDGMGVFEIRPRNPFQTFRLAKSYFDNVFQD